MKVVMKIVGLKKKKKKGTGILGEFLFLSLDE